MARYHPLPFFRISILQKVDAVALSCIMEKILGPASVGMDSGHGLLGSSVVKWGGPQAVPVPLCE